MKKPKKSTIIIIFLAGVAYLFWRQKSALASPGVIGGNKLPLGDLSAASSLQSAVANYVDAGKTRMAQQAEMFAQDKKAYEETNPGKSYEDFYNGAMN